MISFLKWKKLALPKDMGEVVVHKYILPQMVDEWVKNPMKNTHNVSSMSKVVALSFPRIAICLVWKVGDGGRVKLWEDPWVGCYDMYRLSKHTIDFLRGRDLYKPYSHFFYPRLTTI